MKKALLVLVQFLCVGVWAQSVFINEIHYDNAGGDVGEGFEIAGPAGTNLDAWSVVFYNGSNGSPYGSTQNLSGTLANQSNGYGFFHVSLPANGLQNGAPDGLALINDQGVVVQFLSYEGTLVANGGPADGMTSTDIGVEEGGGTPIGHSLQLGGTGSVYNDFTWQEAAQNTFGAPNNGQIFEDNGGNPPPLLFAVQEFKVISNTQIDIAFSKKLDPALTGLDVDNEGTSLENISFTLVMDSILRLNFDSFTLGTTQTLRIFRDIQSLEAETLSADINESFLFNNSTPNLVISEIMYNNASETTFQDDLEFLELYNNSHSTIQLGGFVISKGVVYTFPEGSSLAANEFYVLATDTADFRTAFGLVATDQWSSGALGNGGEEIEIQNTENTVIDLVDYDDGGAWPSEADGDGPSLEIIDPNADNNDPSNWRASESFAGIYQDAQQFASPFSLQGTVITRLNVVDLNIVSDAQIDIAFSAKFDIATINLNEITGLPGAASVSGTANDSIVSLSLSNAFEIGEEYTISIAVDFISDANGLEMQNAFERNFLFNNSLPSLVISEIMYNLPGDDAGLEFLELYNNSDDSIDISGFKITEGIVHTFGKGSKVAPREFVLLAEDGSKASALFGIAFSSWDGNNLNNGGETIRLVNAQNQTVDVVSYDDSAPWPSAADGDGPSLEIIDPDLENNNANNWRASSFFAATVNGQDIFASPGALEVNTNAYFYFLTDSAAVTEGKSYTLNVHLKNANRINTTVQVAISGGDAEEGLDFEIDTKSIVYTGEETIFGINIKALKDFQKEDLEFIELSLTAPRLALITQETSTARIYILDTDQGSANICLNEISRGPAGVVSPNGNEVPFIEFANVDFYGINLNGYHVELSTPTNSIRIDLGELGPILSGGYNTIWIEGFSNAAEVLDFLSNRSGDLAVNLKRGNISLQRFTLPTLPDGMVYARVTDCNEQFEMRDTPSPNANNGTVGINDHAQNGFSLYPNPSSNRIHFGVVGHYSIMQSNGTIVMEIKQGDAANISRLESGLYLVKNAQGTVQSFVKN